MLRVRQLAVVQKLLIYRSLQFRLFVRSVSSTRAVKGDSPGMELQRVVTELHKMFPPCLAEDWDNVGLLVEPSSHVHQLVNHLVLTNDLTEEVMEEIEKAVPKVGLIVAYHPPIFKPLKALTRITAKERIILKAVESRIAIYSPHTAADSVYGGVNDWLAKGLGDGNVTPLKPAAPQYDVKASRVTSEQCDIISEEIAYCGQKLRKDLRYHIKKPFITYIITALL